MTEVLGDPQHAGRVGEQSIRRVNRSARGREALRRKSGLARARDGRDQSVWRYPAHTMIASISDVQIAIRVDCNAAGAVERRQFRQAAIATKAERAIAGERAGEARSCQEPHATTVSDEQVTETIGPDLAR